MHAAEWIDIFQQPLAVVHPGGSFSILVELRSEGARQPDVHI